MANNKVPTKAEIKEKKLQNKLKTAKNVEERNGKIRIQFKLPDRDKYIWRSIGIKATEHNIDIAIATLVEIKTDIKSGCYEKNPTKFWIDHFPLSTEAKYRKKVIRLKDLFEQYAKEREHELSYSMKNKLKTCKNWVDSFKLLNKPVTSITCKDLDNLRQKSLKTRMVVTVREYSHILHQVLRLATLGDDPIIENDPFNGVRAFVKDNHNKKNYLIKPFSKNELTALIDAVHIPQTKLLVEFLAWTGLRHGEMKALAWEDIEFHNNCLYVNYNLDREGKLKPPKTESGVRKVEMLPAIIKLLKIQKEKTFKVPAKSETIYFLNNRSTTIKRRRVFLSRGNKPYKRPELTTNRNHWATWLMEAGLTYRSAYQLRHTFASQMLMARADTMWLAKQLGHANWGYVQSTYARWIEEENPDYIQGLAKNLGQEYE
jgi:integrase